MRISETKEDYLEKILMINEEKGSVHGVDLANKLNISKPTVSIAMKKLEDEGLISVDDSKNISLTAEGLVIAEKTYEKHNLIAKVLISLGVSEHQAFEDSCHIEHCLSDESFAAIKKTVEENGL